MRGSEPKPQSPRTSFGRLARVRIARLDLGADDQPQPRHEVGVIAVRGAPRLLRVVRDHSTFLLAIKWLDRGVDVENPRRIKQQRHTFLQVPVQPGDACGFGGRGERPAQGILAESPCSCRAAPD
jgi:hypothetical protein